MAFRWITAMWPRKGFAVVKMVSISRQCLSATFFIQRLVADQRFATASFLTTFLGRHHSSVVPSQRFSVGVGGDSHRFCRLGAKAQADVMNAVDIFQMRQKAPTIDDRTWFAGAEPFFCRQFAKFLPRRGQHSDTGCGDAD